MPVRQVVAQWAECHPVWTTREVQTGQLTDGRSLKVSPSAGEEERTGGIYSNSRHGSQELDQEQAYSHFINQRGVHLSFPSYSVTLSKLPHLFPHLQNRDSYSSLYRVLGGSTEMRIVVNASHSLADSKHSNSNKN